MREYLLVEPDCIDDCVAFAGLLRSVANYPGATIREPETMDGRAFDCAVRLLVAKVEELGQYAALSRMAMVPSGSDCVEEMRSCYAKLAVSD